MYVTMFRGFGAPGYGPPLEMSRVVAQSYGKITAARKQTLNWFMNDQMCAYFQLDCDLVYYEISRSCGDSGLMWTVDRWCHAGAQRKTGFKKIHFYGQ